MRHALRHSGLVLRPIRAVQIAAAGSGGYRCLEAATDPGSLKPTLHILV